MIEGYIIASEHRIMIIQGVRLFGQTVTMPALFKRKSEALAVLFELEEAGVIVRGSHTIRPITQLVGEL